MHVENVQLYLEKYLYKLSYTSSAKNSELNVGELLLLMLASCLGDESFGQSFADVVLGRVGSDFSGELAVPRMALALGFTGYSLDGRLIGVVEDRLRAKASGKKVEVSGNRGTLVVKFSEKALDVSDGSGEES